MLTACNIQYEIAERTRAVTPGGIGAMHLMARKLGLIDAIDRQLHLLKVHLPYHESDHVLNIAYNLLAGGTCLEQLKSGVRSLSAPVDNLTSNSYMAMASLAWSLKAWLGLLLPVNGRWQKKQQAEKDSVVRMEFKKFVNAFVQIPAQVVRTGRRLVFRLLGWNPWLHVFIRAAERFEHPLLC